MSSDLIVGYPLEREHYHLAIKAFAKQGDLKSAFQLVDGMMNQGLEPNQQTYSFLLYACIADEKAGFALAIRLWRRMIRHSVFPTIDNYNLLLRACRDCALGDLELTNRLLKSTPNTKLPPPPPPLLLLHLLLLRS